MVNCDPYTGGNLTGALMSGNYTDAVVCPYDLQVGPIVFGLIVYGSVMTALYIRTQSIVVPMVVTILAGTVAISRIPSQAAQLMAITLMLGLTIAMYVVYQRVQTMT